ncbi:methyltransferase domain-containing protein [Nocardioides sp.]|uniref:methyltransferase domain-containing protein n=1 Tax=Nocardioides sp. TaxID=35761 RepID=UPI00356654DE
MSADMVETRLSLEDWTHAADLDDLAIIALCEGPTIDLGCGPGRLTEALTRHGHLALGVDVTGEAVAHTLQRGVAALRRDVFGPLPGEGRWHTALLADGNVGIGGNPVALLDRVRRLLDPRGHAVVEVAPPGTAMTTGPASLHAGDLVTRTFDWTVVGVDQIESLTRQAGLVTRAIHPIGCRFVAVVEVAA